MPPKEDTIEEGITPDEATALLKFLDRAELRGHVERNTMNVLVNKLVVITGKTKAAKPPKKAEPKKPSKDT